MRHASKTAILGIAALGGFLGGCATSMQTGPGYYRYDTHLAGTAPSDATPTTVYVAPAPASAPAPAPAYNPPLVNNPPTTYYGNSVNSTSDYNTARGTYNAPLGGYPSRGGGSTSYNDHGQ